ncbi:hypothetical protein Nepgr_016316 [Nepenthes gracilis]|uniref:Uncharacterized protein n=1 Tax=Nepenthes gracilis TaxID=150966 RepID=A0AAD3XSE0_NEPGR|nr:hypothetical protein Nepgr_016316 [Nepenthes gracilis]
MQRLDGVLVNTMGVDTLEARKSGNPSKNIGPSEQLAPVSDKAINEAITRICSLHPRGYAGVKAARFINSESIARNGPSCQGDHHSGDQCSCTSIGVLRKNIAELRKQFVVSRPRAIEESPNPGSSQVGSVKKSKSCRCRKSPLNPMGTKC